jgi:hypothetical protein
MGHNDNSLLTGPFEGHNNDTASATETIDNFFSMPEDKLAEKIKETTPPQLIDHEDAVGGSNDTGSGGNSQKLADLIDPEDISLPNVEVPEVPNVGNVGGGINDTVDDVADGIDNTVDNATPDFSGLGGFADKFLIGLALTLVAAAAASSVFS